MWDKNVFKSCDWYLELDFVRKSTWNVGNF